MVNESSVGGMLGLQFITKSSAAEHWIAAEGQGNQVDSHHNSSLEMPVLRHIELMNWSMTSWVVGFSFTYLVGSIHISKADQTK